MLGDVRVKNEIKAYILKGKVKFSRNNRLE